MDACALDHDASPCGRLPLALEIAATLLGTHPGVDLDKLAGQSEGGYRPLAALCRGDRTQPGESSVQVALDIAYRGLPDRAARVFRLLPVNPGPDMSTDAIAAFADLPVSEIGEVLVNLTRACLIEPTSGHAGQWRMNVLVRRYAEHLSQAHAEADRREQSIDRLLKYYLNMTAAANEHFRVPPRTWLHGEFPGRDEALSWLDTERPNLVAAVRMAADTGRSTSAINLPLLLAHYFVHRGDFDDLLATTSVSLRMARRHGKQAAEAAALTNLGGALLETGRFDEAVTAHQDAAAIFRETGNRRREGDALNNLGVALTAMGQARPRRSPSTRRPQPSSARQATSTDWVRQLNNLGVALTAMGQARPRRSPSTRRPQPSSARPATSRARIKH